MATSYLVNGDCLEQLKKIPDESIDAVIQDPPYNLNFMNKKWDSIGGSKEYQRWCEEWAKECFRVLRKGGYLVSFGGTRTYHRMVSGIEDAGFFIKDSLTWHYGTGFPKSTNISKQADKRGGEDVSWFGEWLKQWRTENGIPQKEVAKLFPSKTGRITGCVANWELGFNLPTNEQFNKICKHFELPFENIEEAKREIIKKDIRVRKNDSWESNGTGMLGAGIQDFSITAPSTTLAQRWEGYGTALKPATEPIVLAQKPIEKTYLTNIIKHGVGALNIDKTRIPPNEGRWPSNVMFSHHPDCRKTGEKEIKGSLRKPTGKPLFEPNQHDNSMKWNNNQVKDTTTRGYDKETIGVWECHMDCPIHMLDVQSGDTSCTRIGNSNDANKTTDNKLFGGAKQKVASKGKSYRDGGGASRFFYQPKASKNEKTCGGQVKNTHPTVKPISLMKWLIQLVCPSAESMQRNPIILDCFMGSGTTIIASQSLGMDSIGIEKNQEYVDIAKNRLLYENEEIDIVEGFPAEMNDVTVDIGN